MAIVTPLMQVQELQVHFHAENRVARAVDGVDFRLNANETVCIVGESGCGKTVSALAMLGLLRMPPARIAGGRVLFNGEDLLQKDEEALRGIRGKRIAMVFQEPMTSLNPVFTVGDQVAEAILAHDISDESAARQHTLQLLADVGIPDPERTLDCYPHQLSGGQRQRVMIAMALACAPEMIIADEPTTALDVTVQAQILRLLRRLQRDHRMAVLYITHDLGVVSAIADRVYVMYAGLVVEEADVDRIFNGSMHPYTRALLAALPTRDKRGRRLYSIPGTVPHPAYKPAGCPFHPRCEYRRPSCEQQHPVMVDHGNGHRARCPVLASQDTTSLEEQRNNG